MARGPRERHHLEVHCRRRIIERFPRFRWVEGHYEHLCKLVRGKNLIFLFRESNSRTHWLINLGGDWGSLVYNHNAKGISTALNEAQTRNCLRAYGLELDDFIALYNLPEESLYPSERKRTKPTAKKPPTKRQELTPYEEQFLPSWALPIKPN